MVFSTGADPGTDPGTDPGAHAARAIMESDDSARNNENFIRQILSIILGYWTDHTIQRKLTPISNILFPVSA
jgi:hypothetical protein